MRFILPALPGQAASAPAIAVVSSNSYPPPASSMAFQVTGLPNYTILDSVVPWVLIGTGLLFLFSVFKTRVGIATSKDGRKIQTKTPPFYTPPKVIKLPPPPPPTPVRIVE